MLLQVFLPIRQKMRSAMNQGINGGELILPLGDSDVVLAVQVPVVLESIPRKTLNKLDRHRLVREKGAFEVPGELTDFRELL